MVLLAELYDSEPTNIFGKIVMCFSVRRNWKTFNIEPNNEVKDKLYVVNGLKWATEAHSLYKKMIKTECTVIFFIHFTEEQAAL